MRVFAPQQTTLALSGVDLDNFTCVHQELYGLPFSTGQAADSQSFLEAAGISDVEDKPTFLPFLNGAGQSLAIGSVVCWKTDPLRRRVAEVANAFNRYSPAGVVVRQAVAKNEFGWLIQQGPVVNALVLGAADLTYGTVLDVVPGQVYLQGTTSVLTAGARYHFRILENHLTSAVQLKRVRVDCSI